MKIGIITNIRAPYRTMQINEYTKIDNCDVTVYYTEGSNTKIKWEALKPCFKEINLKENKFLKKIGLVMNSDLTEIVKENDLIILSGYQQLSIIFTSVLCRIFKKKYVITFDGISVNKVYEKSNLIKDFIKKIVVNGSSFVMANGEVGKLYFKEKFNYPENRIVNQCLAIDSDTIVKLREDREKYRTYYREKYNIPAEDKVILYTGRLISIKNVKALIKAISLLDNSDVTLLITGGGVEEEEILQLAKNLNVKIVVTGFLSEQEELFKHYFAADLHVLPSLVEPWGLVVNETMTCGLPVLVSNICGCSLDMVQEGKNGYKIDPNSIEDISSKIKTMLFKSDLKNMGKESEKIISKWTHKNAAKNLEKIIEMYNKE